MAVNAGSVVISLMLTLCPDDDPQRQCHVAEAARYFGSSANALCEITQKNLEENYRKESEGRAYSRMLCIPTPGTATSPPFRTTATREELEID